MEKVKNENYFTVQGWMLNELKLKGIELMLYAIIWGFTQEVNTFTGSLSYLEEFTGSSRPTIIGGLKRLCEKKLLEKYVVNTDKGKVCIYKAVKKLDYPSKETLLPLVKKLDYPSKETLPNNIYNNINENIYTTSVEVEKKEVLEKKKKHKYGEYKNVLLQDAEKEKLNNELGIAKAEAVINYFSELKEMKGYKYKSDYIAIKKWGISAYEKNVPQKEQRPQETKVYNFNPCPQCKKALLFEKDNGFICDGCGITLQRSKAMEYFRSLHNRG